MTAPILKRLILGCLLTIACACHAQKAPFSQHYGDELIRYLYRWHLDDAILAETLGGQEHIMLYYRYLEPEQRDEGDRSEHLEVVLPVAKLYVRLKRADYQLQKHGVEVRNAQFKFLSAQHFPDETDFEPAGYEFIRYDLHDMLDRLHRFRNEAVFPSGATMARLRVEAHATMRKQGYFPDTMSDDVTQIAYMAPISIVSNDLWCYWVNGRKFLHFTSDLDPEHPSFWDLARVSVEIIDVDEQVVVSNLEHSGQSYFTKDYIGRILFNCIVHGKEIKQEEDH